MLSVESIPKSIKRNLKHIFIIYVVFNIIYISVHFYQLSNISHTAKTRRNIIQSANLMKTQEVYAAENTNVAPSLIQSKLTSSGMGSSDITPYYLKATLQFNTEDISIATIVTPDRFAVLSRLATRYKGPISAAVHIMNNDHQHSVMSQLEKTIQSNPDIKKYVDIHLIVDQFDRQFNMWRNMAKLYARTDYIMMLDIDFYPCTDFRTHFLHNNASMAMLREGRTAFVVPAFEYIDHDDGYNYLDFPTSKEALLEQVFDQERLDMFHRSWEKGHAATNYEKWYMSDTVYPVTDYSFSYEPYVIFKRETSPWCDERFIGYGANKAACLYEMYLSGITYYVLPHDFIIHQSHAYPEATRKKERAFNKKLYTNFREELCLRYARRFIASGEWGSSSSHNLRQECQKIRGFQNTISHIDQ